MVKVSIIVPVYNVEPYLEKCLNSLVNQTLSDIELIVVNDGSRDGSQAIIDSFCNKYPFVKCYQKENGGLSDARNYGLERACGEYIGFVDADDYVDFTMYELLYQEAQKTAADIVECHLYHTYEAKEEVEIAPRLVEPKALLMNGRSVVWNKIYQRQWLLETKVTFHTGKIYEDVEFFLKLIPHIRRISYIDEACIHYVQRNSSLNHQQSLKTLDILDILKEIMRYYQAEGYYETYREALEYFHVRILLCSSFLRMCGIPKGKERKYALQQSWDYLIKTFPDWKKNPYVKADSSAKMVFAKTMNPVTYRIYSYLLSAYVKLRA